MKTKLPKYIVHRVQSAFTWAQKHMKTAYAVEFDLLPKEDRGNSHLIVTRSGRGKADPNLFIVYVNPKSGAELPMRDLRVLAVHEIIHMILWPLSEIAEEGRTKDVQKKASEANEAATYILQRAIIGEASR